MATRTNPLAGRYFNDPALVSAFSNLASAFAPPGPTDYLTAEKVFGQRFQNQSIQDAWAAMTDPNVTLADQDRYGIAATLFGQGYTPTQSNRAVDVASSDRRYATDVGAQNALDLAEVNNDAEMRRQVVDAIMSGATSPITYDEVTPGIDPALATALGATAGVPVPAMQPQSGAALGAPQAPLSETEMMASIIRDLPPEVQRQLAMSDVNVESVVGPSGAPQIVARSDAIGQEPFVNRGAEAAPKPIILVDPSTGQQIAGFAVNGQYVLGDGQTPAPGNLVPQALPQAQGSADELGLGAPNRNRIDAQGLAAVSALDTIGQLETLITQNPGSQGLVGALRGTAQDIIQSGGELGRAFGGTMAEVSAAVERGAIDAGVAQTLFDPNIPAIEMLTNVLAWQYAKSFAGDRVSNEQLRIAREAIGASGMFNNQANSLARLGQLRDMFQRDLSRNTDVYSPEVRALAAPYMNATPGAAAQRPRAVNPDTGETLEFDGQQWVPVQ